MKPMHRALFLGGVAASVSLAFGGLAAYRHVRYYTGDTPRTYDCYSCHVDGNGGGPFDRLARPDYLSPLMLEVAPDGKHLYATAQDGDALLVVDLERQALS
ncbi:MAG: hypothetical protein WAO20_14015, partial [Acidobacteriota bacterium]